MYNYALKQPARRCELSDAAWEACRHCMENEYACQAKLRSTHERRSESANTLERDETQPQRRPVCILHGEVERPGCTACPIRHVRRRRERDGDFAKGPRRFMEPPLLRDLRVDHA